MSYLQEIERLANEADAAERERDEMQRSRDAAWDRCRQLERERDQAIARIAQLEREADLWRRQVAADKQQWRARWQRQVDLTNTFRGRFEVLRHENNKMRKNDRPLPDALGEMTERCYLAEAEVERLRKALSDAAVETMRILGQRDRLLADLKDR